MKKFYFTILILLVLAVSAYAVLPELPRDFSGAKIQDFAPNASKTQVLTINHAVVDITSDLRWSITTPTACKFRVLSSATKTGVYSQVPVNSTITQVVNRNSVKSKFLNFSSCTNADLFRQ